MIERILGLVMENPDCPYAELLAKHDIPYELLLLPGHGVCLEGKGACHPLSLPKVTEAPRQWCRYPPGTVVRYGFRDNRVQDKIVVGVDGWALVLVPLGGPFGPERDDFSRALLPVAA